MNGAPWITRICPKVSLDRKTVRAGTLKCVSLCSSRRTHCTSSAQTHVGSKCGCIEKIFSKSVFLLKQHAQNLPGTGLVYFYILGHFLLTVCSCHKSQTFFYIFYSTLQLSNASADTVCSSLSHWCFPKLGFSFTHEISHYTVLFPHIVGKKKYWFTFQRQHTVQLLTHGCVECPWTHQQRKFTQHSRSH